MSNFVYILQSLRNSQFYIGQTNSIERRLDEHNRGKSRSTKANRPWKLYWCCEVGSRSEALRLERSLKNMKSRKRLLEWVARKSEK